jgi:hypothetical protein
MNKLRLAHVIPVLPRYHNSFKKGLYKDGNIMKVHIYIGDKICFNIYDANEIPREYYERPWYISRIEPKLLSCYHATANIGLKIYLSKEEF